MILFDIDGPLLAHVAVALVRHRDGLRREGREVPAGLVELVETVLFRARGGHARTTGDDAGVVVDDASMAPLLLTKAETAQLLNVSPRTVQRLVAEGRLPLVRVAGAPRFRRVDVEGYVDDLAGQTTKETA